MSAQPREWSPWVILFRDTVLTLSMLFGACAVLLQTVVIFGLATPPSAGPAILDVTELPGMLFTWCIRDDGDWEVVCLDEVTVERVDCARAPEYRIDWRMDGSLLLRCEDLAAEKEDGFGDQL